MVLVCCGFAEFWFCVLLVLVPVFRCVYKFCVCVVFGVSVLWLLCVFWICGLGFCVVLLFSCVCWVNLCCWCSLWFGGSVLLWVFRFGISGLLFCLCFCCLFVCLVYVLVSTVLCFATWWSVGRFFVLWSGLVVRCTLYCFHLSICVSILICVLFAGLLFGFVALCVDRFVVCVWGLLARFVFV